MPFQWPSRGDVWLLDVGEQGGGEERTGLVVSDNDFNHSPAGLAVVLPLTRRYLGINHLHIEVTTVESGLGVNAYIQCDQLLTVTTEQLLERRSQLSSNRMRLVDDRL